MAHYISDILKRTFLFFYIVSSLLVAVATYGSSTKDILLLMIVSIVFLFPLFFLTLNKGQTILSDLFKKDIFGVSIALFYAIFFTAISFVVKITLFEDFPVFFKFFVLTILICASFGSAHKRQNEPSFTYRDFIILLALITVYRKITYNFSAENFAVNIPLLTIFIAMRSLPYNIALLIFFVKRNVNRNEFSLNLSFRFIDFLYFLIFFPVILLLLYLSRYSIRPFLDTISLKLIIFNISFEALVSAIPEEILFMGKWGRPLIYK